jgi:hypothetical protein
MLKGKTSWFSSSEGEVMEMVMFWTQERKES